MLQSVTMYFVAQEALKSPLCDRVYLTHIEKVFPVDTYFPVQVFQDEGFKQIRYLRIPCYLSGICNEC